MSFPKIRVDAKPEVQAEGLKHSTRKRKSVAIHSTVANAQALRLANLRMTAPMIAARARAGRDARYPRRLNMRALRAAFHRRGDVWIETTHPQQP